MYVNYIKCMSRLLNALVQQLCMGERVGFEHNYVGMFLLREQTLLSNMSSIETE